MQLTPNRRLAIYLTEQGEIEVFSFSQWLEKLWQDYPQSKPLLLSATEQQILWERIIGQSREDYPLLNTASTTKMAMEAWKICHQWEIPMNTGDWQREDSQVFLEWAKAFQAECEQHHWIDTPGLVPWLVHVLERGELQLPARIECVGFQEWDPQQKRLLNLCRRLGTVIKESSLLKEKGEVFQLAAASPTQEIEWAIQWAAQVLKSNPNARFGMVVPDLEQRRFEVLRLLEAQFKPGHFNVSAPLPSSNYPLIDAALLGLRALEAELSFAEWSKFLRLPFFGRGISEMAYRSQLDVLFREKPRPSEFSLEIFVSIMNSLLKKLPRYDGVDFQFPGLISNCLSQRFAVQGRRSTEEWASLFTQILSSLEWPGERTLTSLEYQLKIQWDKILLEYQRLGHLLGKHRYADALREIQRLCVANKFLPQSEKTPIQVLGLLEGLGLPFDYLWVVGLSREVWPKEPAPHPFIPLNLQRSLGVPRSSAARELQVALQMTEQLSCGGETVIFSYPERIDDNKTSISSLLAQLPSLAAEALGIPIPRSWKSLCAFSGTGILPSALVTASLLATPFKSTQGPPASTPGVTDHLGDDFCRESIYSNSFGTDSLRIEGKETDPTVVPHQRGEPVTQGSRFLKLQSACPFRAFAEIRLKARPLGEEQWGLNPAERGEILHQIMHLFWRGLDSQAALKALSDVKREGRLYWAVDVIFNQWKRDHRYRLQSRYFAIEQARAVRLVRQFIELDLARPPFEVVAHEIEQSVVLSGVPLKLRIDRIDRLETGEEILIDYKTGKTNVAEWFGERPVDPQLPLYCVARKPRPTGVAFALLRSDKIRYQGLADNPDDLPGTLSAVQLKRYGCEESLETQVEIWQARLNALAEEFMLGRADVAPLLGKQTCRSCHLQPLCRFSA